MARLQRFVAPGLPHLIVQQGHNDGPVFRDQADVDAFMGWVDAAFRRSGVLLHAYLLLPTAVYLLATPSDKDGLGNAMQWVGRHYVPYFNRRWKRRGTLWQDRFRTSVIEPDHSVIEVCHYLAQIPVRTGLAPEPETYLWSSVADATGLRRTAQLTLSDHAAYWALSNTPFGRQAAFRQRIVQPVADRQFMQWQQVLEAGWVLGGAAFKARLCAQGHPHVEPVKRGRPPLADRKKEKPVAASGLKG